MLLLLFLFSSACCCCCCLLGELLLLFAAAPPPNEGERVSAVSSFSRGEKFLVDKGSEVPPELTRARCCELSLLLLLLVLVFAVNKSGTDDGSVSLAVLL